MLVLLSNLHLTDGSCGDHSASDRLTGAINELKYALKNSRSLTEEIDIVLLGDTFDFVTSRKWHDHGTRPWDHSLQSSVAKTVEMIFEEIVARYSHGFTILTRLLEDGIDIGSSQKNSSRIPIQLHCMVGDTDRMLHHFGPAYDAVRQRVCDLMCLSNPHDVPFPHEPIESETILSLLTEHGIFARHGDLQDPWSCEGDRRTSSVNELVQIELVQPFVRDVLENYSDDFADDAREQLIGMIQVHHVTEIRAKLLAFGNGMHKNSKFTKQVFGYWHDCLEQFLRHKKLQNRIAWQPLDLVSELRRRLTMENHGSISRAIEPHFWFDGSMESQNHMAWITRPNALRNDQCKTQYFVTAHYSQGVVLEVLDRPSRVDLVPLRRAA